MLGFIFCFLFSTSINALAEVEVADDFTQFLHKIHIQALARGISKETLEQTLDGLTINPAVIKFDRSQAEFSQNFWYYLNVGVSPYRLEKGIEALSKQQKILQQTYQKYGVAPSVLVAFWGMETNYGRNTGKMNLLRSLATLSFDKRRSAFFTEQLLILLLLIEQGKISKDATGSWAGAMGNMQFMPSNVATYALDANKNGRFGLWDEPLDIFYSGANFLKHIGWHKGEKWGREVKIADDFDFKLANLKIKKSLDEWQTLGVRNAQGGNLPQSSLKAALILPMGYQGPAFLVYRNFHAILRWNRSILYALAVGHLADRLAGGAMLVSRPMIEPLLSRDDILQIQTKLNQLGFDSGEPDGISGAKTRAAVRAYQSNFALPIDGYVGYQLFNHLLITKPKIQNED